VVLFSATKAVAELCRDIGHGVLRRVFVLTTNEVTAGWRQAHDEERHNAYCSPDIIRAIILAGHVARIWEMITTYKVVAGDHERKQELGRPRLRCEHNIKMNVEDVACEGMDWTGLAQCKVQWWVLVNTV
jgi:hypothetical protein